MDKTSLNSLTLQELEEVKANVAEIIKEKKAEAKQNEKAERAKADAARAENAHKNIREGAEITFIYKGEEHKGFVDKIGNKTVTVQIDGEPRYIKFEKIVLA